jgi:peptidoglycan/xylan/chitin deacetylase (PgdA/CDA1 family)
MSALTPIFRRLSPSGPDGRLSILIFHRVVPYADPLFPGLPDAVRFGAMLGWLKGWFNVLPLPQAVQHLVKGTLPERAAAITFDDGYADNREVALPLLQHHGVTATFFIATGFLDGGRMWNDSIIEAIRRCQHTTLDLTALGLGRHPLAGSQDRRAAIDACIAQLKYRPTGPRNAVALQIAEIANVDLPSTLMMSSDEVRNLHRAGMQIGAHTVTHPILTKLTPDEARREIQDSRTYLESLLGERVSLFAYPNGKLDDDYAECHADLVRKMGFDAAVSTDRGVADASSDIMRLPRFTPWDRSHLRFGGRLLSNLMHARPSVA